MLNSNSKAKTIGVNYNVRTLVLMSLLIAMSIVFGKVLAFNIGPLRISFENLPLLMAGIFISPLAGLITGAMADIIGCMLVGYAINPIITLGGACIGLIGGLLWHYMPIEQPVQKLLASVMYAHVVGSMIIKSIGLMIGFGYTIQAVALRVPLYIGIGLIEFSLLNALLKNKAFTAQLERIRNRK